MLARITGEPESEVRLKRVFLGLKLSSEAKRCQATREIMSQKVKYHTSEQIRSKSARIEVAK